MSVDLWEALDGLTERCLPTHLLGDEVNVVAIGDTVRVVAPRSNGGVLYAVGVLAERHGALSSVRQHHGGEVWLVVGPATEAGVPDDLLVAIDGFDGGRSTVAGLLLEAAR